MGEYKVQKVAFDAQVDTWQDSLVEAAYNYDGRTPWTETQHETNETHAVVRVSESHHGILELRFLVICEFHRPRLQQKQLGEQRDVELGHFEARYWGLGEWIGGLI